MGELVREKQCKNNETKEQCASCLWFIGVRVDWETAGRNEKFQDDNEFRERERDNTV